MADVIHEPTDNFPFDQVTLTAPVAIAGGNHHMKYVFQGKPLYMQTPVCKIKGGVHFDLSGNKRPICDLMFTNENESWIRWMEELETHTCKYMFERREKWFASDLEMTDIENYFQSPLKIYKSGKFYVARTNIPVRLGKVTLKIYDDSEREIDPATITDDTDVMTILQVHGIKCSARSFQVELELKQILVLSPTNVFDKCLLLGNHRNAATAADAASEPSIPTTTVTAALEPEVVSEPTLTLTPMLTSTLMPTLMPMLMPTLMPTSTAPVDDLLAVDISLDETSDAVEIKPRNQVFYEIYREARRKAKEARAAALAAYLEVKHIKDTYNINDDEVENEADDGPPDFRSE
jgi:hypothetical protein